MESGRRRRGNEACDFNPQARWEAPENIQVDRKLSPAGRKPLFRSLPAALAGILSVARAGWMRRCFIRFPNPIRGRSHDAACGVFPLCTKTTLSF
jgi:hypothetical protein